MYLAPSASTWSRVRHCSSSGQPPLRSRSEPLGLSGQHPAAQEKVNAANAELEVCCWFMAQALSCSTRYVHALLIFPEDLGGDAVDGPTSIWEAQEVRTLDGVNDAQRGASFLCSLTGADQRRPLGFLTNLVSLKAKMFCGWPSLYQIDRDILYNGPLPPSCQCSLPHPPLRSVHSREEFISSSSSTLNESFWQVCVAPFSDSEYTSLREGGAPSTYSGTHLSARSPGFSFFAPSFFFGLVPFVVWFLVCALACTHSLFAGSGRFPG